MYVIGQVKLLYFTFTLLPGAYAVHPMVISRVHYTWAKSKLRSKAPMERSSNTEQYVHFIGMYEDEMETLELIGGCYSLLMYVMFIL